MPEYDISVLCMECGSEHPLLIKIFLANGPDRKQSISEWSKGKPIPPQALALKHHAAHCRKTGKKFLLDQDDRVFLVPLWP